MNQEIKRLSIKGLSLKELPERLKPYIDEELPEFDEWMDYDEWMEIYGKYYQQHFAEQKRLQAESLAQTPTYTIHTPLDFRSSTVSVAPKKTRPK